MLFWPFSSRVFRGHRHLRYLTLPWLFVSFFQVSDQVKPVNFLISENFNNVFYRYVVCLGICFNSKTQRFILKLTAKVFSSCFLFFCLFGGFNPSKLNPVGKLVVG